MITECSRVSGFSAPSAESGGGPFFGRGKVRFFIRGKVKQRTRVSDEVCSIPKAIYCRGPRVFVFGVSPPFCKFVQRGRHEWSTPSLPPKLRRIDG